MHECEECAAMVTDVRPCYAWDHNSARVCKSCRVTINRDHPTGDPKPSQIVETLDGSRWRIPVACVACGSEYLQIDGGAYCEDCGAAQPMTTAD